MTPGAVLDTGPLVAFLNRRDRHHDWAKRTLGSRRPPFVTCEAVLSEACFVLRAHPPGVDAVMSLLEEGLLQTPFRLDVEVSTVRHLMARYANVPMSLADACLVRMSEQHSQVPVVTCDGDFNVYRKSGRRVIPTLMPEPP